MFCLLKRPARRSPPAFTLLELLVVIAIVGMLVSLLLAAIHKVREAANRTKCLSNLRQTALAALHYHETRDAFPAGFHVAVDTGTGRFAQGTAWCIELLPYLDQGNLLKKWDYNDFSNNLAGGRNATSAQVVNVLLCPSDPLPDTVFFLPAFADAPDWAWISGYYGIISYAGNGGTLSQTPDSTLPSTDGVFYRDSQVRMADITDGASTTFLFGERNHRDPQYDRISFGSDWYPFWSYGGWAYAVDWGAEQNYLLSTPVPINYQVPPSAAVGDVNQIVLRLCAFGSAHPGGANFAFADGSVRFVRDTTDLTTLRALSTRAGGETADLP